MKINLVTVGVKYTKDATRLFMYYYFGNFENPDFLNISVCNKTTAEHNNSCRIKAPQGYQRIIHSFVACVVEKGNNINPRLHGQRQNRVNVGTQTTGLPWTIGN